MLLLGAALALAGCQSLYTGGATASNTSKKGKKVRVVEKNLLILMIFGYDEDLVFEARKQLLAKCKKGATGISLASEATSYILFGYQTVTIEASCL